MSPLRPSHATGLPPFLAELLSAPPRAGEGVHVWLFRVSRQLHAHWPAPRIVDALRARLAGCGRRVPRAEVEAAVANSLRCAWQPRDEVGPAPATRTWPRVNEAHREAILRENGAGLADLWEQSPRRFEDNDCHAEEIADALFPGNPLLCCAWAKDRFDTRSREEWRGHLGNLAQIVPSTMVARRGLTKNGRESAHTLAATGPRRFIVVEFDSGTLDEQATLLLRLGRHLPLVCAVFSGGKSLHGWFPVCGLPEATVHEFFRYAVTLGADPALWTRSQFARMPDGRRDDGRRQTCYFLNPDLLRSLPNEPA